MTLDTATAGVSVMYHYVRADGSDVPRGIRPFMTSEFEAQLDWLAERWDIVGADEFSAWLAGDTKRARPPCLLTFDDGVRDQHEVILPILRRRGLSGVFFVLNWPLRDGRMPLTHLMHWVLGHDEETVWATFVDHAERHLGGRGVLGDDAAVQTVYPLDSLVRARIKYAANIALAPEVVEQIVAGTLAAEGLTADALTREWFATADDVRALHEAGMTIGMHGASHRSLQQLGPDAIRAEIADNHAYLADLLGEPPTWWACPFGGVSASPDLVSTMYGALARHGIGSAMTIEKGLITPGSDRMAIPRFDAIDLPPRRDYDPRTTGDAR